MKVFSKVVKTMFTVAGVSLIVINGTIFLMCQQQRTQIKEVYQQFLAEKEHTLKLADDHHANIENLKSQIQTLKQDLDHEKISLENEKAKRIALEEENAGLIDTLSGVRTQVETLKEEMIGWQKDYVAVLSSNEKKVEASQTEILRIKEKLNLLNPIDSTVKVDLVPAVANKK